MTTYPDPRTHYSLNSLDDACALAQRIERTPQWHVTSVAEHFMHGREVIWPYWLVSTEYRDVLNDGSEGGVYPFRQIRSETDFQGICQRITAEGIIKAYFCMDMVRQTDARERRFRT